MNNAIQLITELLVNYTHLSFKTVMQVGWTKVKTRMKSIPYPQTRKEKQVGWSNNGRNYEKLDRRKEINLLFHKFSILLPLLKIKHNLHNFGLEDA